MDKRTALTYIDANGNWHRASKGAPEQVNFPILSQGMKLEAPSIDIHEHFSLSRFSRSVAARRMLKRGFTLPLRSMQIVVLDL